MGEVSREEYNAGQERIHQRVDGIHDSAIRVETSVKHMASMMKDMHGIVHGNGKPGLKENHSTLKTRLDGNDKITWVLLFSLIGACFFIIRNAIVK